MDLEDYSDIQGNVMETEEYVEGHQRYLRLHAIVVELKSSPFYRENTWYDEHYGLLHMYSEHFTNGFANIHPYITDNAFRSKCLKLDEYIDKLMREYEIARWFILNNYMTFNKTVIEVVDYITEMDKKTEKEVDSLCDMFKNI
jgi:hypothetical protein